MRAPRMEGEAGLREARNAHSALGSHEIADGFPFRTGYAAWRVVAKHSTETFSAFDRAIPCAEGPESACTLRRIMGS